MRLKSPSRFALLAFVITLITPYFIIEEQLLGVVIRHLVAPIWSIASNSNGPYFFESPLGMAIDFLPFWGMSLVIVGVIHLTADRHELTRIGYIILVSFLLLLQMTYVLVLTFMIASGPVISYIPLPVVALVAYLLTPFVGRPPEATWEYQPVSETSTTG
ncbi:MAG: hypothetical protein ACFFD6_09890 [Candidatus Thorarchaeota archaeon]